MKIPRIVVLTLCSIVLIFAANSRKNTSETESERDPSSIDTSTALTKIEAPGKQFSGEFLNKDSVALANHFASDGMLGTIKGQYRDSEYQVGETGS